LQGFTYRKNKKIINSKIDELHVLLGYLQSKIRYRANGRNLSKFNQKQKEIISHDILMLKKDKELEFKCEHDRRKYKVMYDEDEITRHRRL
jgi:hypothetical protein